MKKEAVPEKAPVFAHPKSPLPQRTPAKPLPTHPNRQETPKKTGMKLPSALCSREHLCGGRNLSLLCNSHMYDLDGVLVPDSTAPPPHECTTTTNIHQRIWRSRPSNSSCPKHGSSPGSTKLACTLPRCSKDVLHKNGAVRKGPAVQGSTQ